MSEGHSSEVEKGRVSTRTEITSGRKPAMCGHARACVREGQRINSRVRNGGRRRDAENCALFVRVRAAAWD